MAHCGIESSNSDIDDIFAVDIVSQSLVLIANCCDDFFADFYRDKYMENKHICLLHQVLQ